jgi:hypothetical protein
MEQNPEMDPHIYGHLIWQSCKSNYDRGEAVFQPMALEQCDRHMQWSEAWALPHVMLKNWTMALNVRAKSLKPP